VVASLRARALRLNVFPINRRSALSEVLDVAPALYARPASFHEQAEQASVPRFIERVFGSTRAISIPRPKADKPTTCSAHSTSHRRRCRRFRSCARLPVVSSDSIRVFGS
jgi:hypothetical protein